VIFSAALVFAGEDCLCRRILSINLIDLQSYRLVVCHLDDLADIGPMQTSSYSGK